MFRGTVKEISKDDYFFHYLNQIKLIGYRKFKIGDAIREIVAYKEYVTNCKGRQFKFWKSNFRRIVSNALFSFVEKKKRGDCRILFVYGKYGYREDMLPWFNAICSLCHNTMVKQHSEKRRLRIRGLRVLFLLPIWILQYIIHDMTLGVSCSVAVFVYFAVLDYEDLIQGVSWDTTKLVTAFCDRHPSDNLTVQKASGFGIHTATLQHGVYWSGGYRWTDCDFFLGFGRHAKENFNATSPLPKTIFISLGYPKLLLNEYLSYDRKTVPKGIVGVLLSGLEDEDDKLLKYGFGLALKLGLKVCIRSHPGIAVSKIDTEYEKILIKISPSDESLDDFLSSSTFFIAGASTVFMECIIRSIPCFHMRRNNDPYRRVEWCSFENTEELVELYNKFREQPEEFNGLMKETRDYYTEPGNVAENYFNFFRPYDV